MEEADIQFTLAENDVNMTKDVGSGFGSAIDFDAVVTNRQGTCILYVGRTKQIFYNEDGRELDDTEFLKYVKAALCGNENPESEEISGTEVYLDGNAYLQTDFRYYESGCDVFNRILIRKVKSSFIVIMSTYVADGDDYVQLWDATGILTETLETVGDYRTRDTGIGN